MFGSLWRWIWWSAGGNSGTGTLSNVWVALSGGRIWTAQPGGRTWTALPGGRTWVASNMGILVQNDITEAVPGAGTVRFGMDFGNIAEILAGDLISSFTVAATGQTTAG